VLASFLIAVEILFQDIGHKKEPDNGKEDKKFDQDDDPDAAAPRGQIPETVEVKVKNFLSYG
jgi:hypothetical protein